MGAFVCCSSVKTGSQIRRGSSNSSLPHLTRCRPTPPHRHRRTPAARTSSLPTNPSPVKEKCNLELAHSLCPRCRMQSETKGVWSVASEWRERICVRRRRPVERGDADVWWRETPASVTGGKRRGLTRGEREIGVRVVSEKPQGCICKKAIATSNSERREYIVSN